jgi:predicted PurR-regulated permease PerM
MIAASLVIVVAGLREIKPIAVPLIIAGFLSVLSSPILAWLVEHRIPKFIAVFMTVLSNIAVVVVILLLVGSSLRAFSDSLPIYQKRLEDRARSAFSWLEDMGINTSELNWLRDEPLLPDPNLDPAELEEAIEEPPQGERLLNLSALVEVLGSTLRSLASLTAMTVLVFLMMVFILFEASGFPRRLEIALGWKDKDLERLWQAKREIQHYLGIKTAVSLATGFFIYLWVLFSGVEFPLLWGLIAFLLNYIPSLGSILASIPATVIAFIETGPAQALLVVLGYLIVNIVLGNFVEPHLMGRQFGISTLVVFLSLVFWGWVWGPVAMLLSVPLTMILKILLEHTEDLRWMARLISANPVALEPDLRQG